MKKVLLALVVLLCGTLAFAQNKALDPYWNVASQNFPAAGQFTKPPAWKAGQYVVLGTLVNGKRDSVSRTLIVRKDQEGWVIETTNVDKNGKQTATQMCLAGYDEAMAQRDPSKIDLVWMKTLGKDGKVSTTEGQSLAIVKTVMKSSYEKMVVNVGTFTDGGAIQVPAGSFAGTNMVTATAKVMGFTVETTTWFHPSIPVNGMVMSKSKDGKTVQQLLAFGFDGKPTIP